VTELDLADMTDTQYQQMVLSLTPAESLWEQERQSLLNQLAETRAVDQNRLERIQQLEQALDQTLITLEELKQQVQDQVLLEHQLAYTEEFSRVQQQAIAKLNEQLVQHRYQLNQKTQDSGDIAQTSELEKSLGSSSSDLKQLPVPSPATELTHQQVVQVSLQHFCQELAAERDTYRQKVAAFEQQVAEMQEHILQQEQQAREYEAAVQHWKDKNNASYRYALHLKNLLEQIVTDQSVTKLSASRGSLDSSADRLPTLEPNVLLPSLLMAFHALPTSETERSTLADAGLSDDLPAFLTRRRRNYRAS
jgi:chromosome segregation ATPase